MEYLSIRKAQGMEGSTALGKAGGLKRILTRELPDGQADSEKPMSPRGSIFSHSYFDCYILVIMGLDQQLDVLSVKAALKSTLIKHDLFSSIVSKGKWGGCKWVKQEVDMDNHIIVPDLGHSFTQRIDFVEEYTATLASTPLDWSKPLWEIHVLNRESKYAEKTCASAVFKIHHCIGDCVSLMSLFLDCTTKARNATKSLPAMQHHVNSANRNKRPIKTLGFHTIWNAMFVVWCTIIDMFKDLATLLWIKDNIMVEESERRPKPRRIAHATIDLNDVGIIKKAVNGTVNDVVTGILSAGCVTYLSRRYESNNNGKYTKMQNLRLRAIVPVNMRSAKGLHTVEYMTNNPKKAKWGNELGLWILPIPLDKHEDSLQYCRVAISNSRKKKASFQALYMYFFVNLVSWIMGVNAAMYLLYRLCLNTTLVFSNVIGPIQEVQFMDNRITDIVTMVSWIPQPLIVHFQSYAGKAKLAILATKDFIPDPQQLCMDCMDALKRMKEDALISLNHQT